MNRDRWGLIWKIDINLLKEYVLSSYCLAEVIRKIGYKSYSSNHYISLNERIISEKIDISHFDVRKAQLKHNTCNKKMSKEAALEKIFILDSPFHQRTLREYVKFYNLIEYNCSLCPVKDEYNGKKISLQLDHIDRDNKNNQLDNLRWLCPNCHSQTDTFGFKMGKK